MPNYRYTTAPEEVDSGTTLTNHVYEALREEILTGRLQPGQRLVRRAVSERLGVSRMPVSDALVRLELDGLVESRPMIGARVVPLTLQRLRDDQVLREAIECQAARLVAEHASDAELSRLAQQAEAVDRVMGQGDPRSRLGVKLDVDLHLRLARAGGHAVLADELDRIFLRRLMRLNWIKGGLVEQPRSWHAQLIEAVASRKPDVAERAMRRHMRFRRDADAAALAAISDEAAQAPAPDARRR